MPVSAPASSARDKRRRDEVDDLAFNAARDWFRSGGPANVEHDPDPDGFGAECGAALTNAVEGAVAAAGFDVDDLDVGAVIDDAVHHAQCLDSLATSLAYQGGGGSEEYAAYNVLYGKPNRSMEPKRCGQRWRRPVARSRRSRGSTPRRRGSRRGSAPSRGDPDQGEPPRRGRGVAHTHHVAGPLSSGWAL